MLASGLRPVVTPCAPKSPLGSSDTPISCRHGGAGPRFVKGLRGGGDPPWGPGPEAWVPPLQPSLGTWAWGKQKDVPATLADK